MSRQNLQAAVVLILMAATAMGAYFIYSTDVKLDTLSKELTASRAQSELASGARCSETAAKFYKSWNETDPRGPIPSMSSYYENHWNAKQRKCFVKVISVVPASGQELIDVYDALENKHYATFTGHSNCEAALALNCSLDSGDVWLDGNDQKETPDYKVGFGGMHSGQVGNPKTLSDFLAQIARFMEG